MAIHAVALQDPAVFPLDHDGFLEVLRREGLGVVVAVFSLRDVFGNEGMRQMAVNALCLQSAIIGSMGRKLPTLVRGIHLMALRAAVF